jgi:hypothetical protein
MARRRPQAAFLGYGQQVADLVQLERHMPGIYR